MKNIIQHNDPEDPLFGTTTEIDLADPPKVPLSLDHLDFILLCQTAGGMTDAMLVSAHNDAALASLWIKFDHAPENIHQDHPLVGPGLDALAGAGYLPNGKQAVLDAWPTG